MNIKQDNKELSISKLMEGTTITIAVPISIREHINELSRKSHLPQQRTLAEIIYFGTKRFIRKNIPESNQTKNESK